jgi:hypothetical protein
MPLDAGTGAETARRDSDVRFAALIGEAGWRGLGLAVRRRFSRHVGDGETVVYEGRVIAMHHSRLGSALAAAARLIGGMLPLPGPAGARAVVIVSEDRAAAGQIWTRVYARPGRFPQTVNSVKQFRGPTGLLERLGYGLHMYLDISVENGSLVFRSRGYGLGIGSFMVRMPRVLLPIDCEVRHEPIGETTFDFVLLVSAPIVGTLIHQRCRFADPIPGADLIADRIGLGVR